MLFGAVVYDTDAHFFPGRDPEFGDAGAVKLGTQAQLRVKTQVLAVWFVDALWH